MSSKIIIYADGGCRGNQNKKNIGGWGAVLRHGSHSKNIYGHEFDTTNNKMELTAAIKALEAIKNNKYPIEIYMDSAYVVNGITQWLPNWIRRGWVKSDKKPVENKELWQRLHQLKESLGFVSFHKVKGHAGVADNELADELANIAMDEAELIKGGK